MKDRPCSDLQFCSILLFAGSPFLQSYCIPKELNSLGDTDGIARKTWGMDAEFKGSYWTRMRRSVMVELVRCRTSSKLRGLRHAKQGPPSFSCGRHCDPHRLRWWPAQLWELPNSCWRRFLKRSRKERLGRVCLSFCVVFQLEKFLNKQHTSCIALEKLKA